ncbi:MAG: SDR family oxidoreductase [Methyloligellaceae bacterium]
MPHLFCFGLGYSALEFAQHLLSQSWTISGTTRRPEKASELQKMGIEAYVYDDREQAPQINEQLSNATHLLHSIAPTEAGDPVFANFADDISKSESLEWFGYLSTVGVYGNWDGAWIDEEAEPKPVSKRSKWRLAAENSWLQWAGENNKNLHVFRLSGIYGPKRSAIDRLLEGSARRIDKPGQVFNRIHVTDIARALFASTNSDANSEIYNLTDDEPAPPQDVVAYAAELLGVEAPPLVSFEDADLSPMGRSFYGENKRVSNARIKQQLNLDLLYPTYREGLRAIAENVSNDK